MISCDLDVFARMGFPKTAERMRTALCEEKQRLREAVGIAHSLSDALSDLVSDVEAKNNGNYSGNVSVEKAVGLLKSLNAYEGDYREREGADEIPSDPWEDFFKGDDRE